MAGKLASSGGGKRGRHEVTADPNVIPFIDVMLVLLIIFMVAAPMLQRGIHLELPATKTATEIREARIEVSIDRDGRIQINERPIHAELLEERMKALAASAPDETVFLRADRLLPYGEVLLVMDRIRAAGITRVSLVTVPLERPDRR
jgi:biopolymer transport protein TolR